MRLERLEIAGFGRLRSVAVELHPRITVLCGGNESGKSTVHRAVRAALYGLDAGSQGRAVAASDWARWRPWRGETYGLTLVYTLADGRRFRVARRLEERDQRAQVVEVGGRDQTDAMRIGRGVVPAQVHLGIDEAVFCATACLGEESLRPDAPDGAAERAERLQEAMERLADSASRATAAEALARLHQAMDRVGTEGRSRSPLGRATTRLRELEASLADARRRTAAVAAEQARLIELDHYAARAEQDRLRAERAWIAGRIAGVAGRRQELIDAVGEMARLETAIAGWSDHAAFPVDREEQVITLGGSLRMAVEAEAEAASRWAAASPRLSAAERRRQEITTSMTALDGVPRVSEADREERRELVAAVLAETAVERRAETICTAQARADALRREIAAGGLGSVPLGAAEPVAELVATALEAGPGRRLRPVAMALAGLGAVLATGAWLAALHPIAAICLGVGLVGALGVLLAERLGRGPGAEARRRLAQRCPGLDLSPAGLRRAAERLPGLTRLHADLQRQETLAESGRAELEATATHIAGLTRRCEVLAARLPVEVRGPDPAVPGPAALLARAKAALAAVEQAEGAGRRRAELEDEDAALAREITAGEALQADAERTATVRAGLAAELAGHVEAGGLAPETDPTRAVAAFRQACATRRQLEAAGERLIEVRRRTTGIGAPDAAGFDRQLAGLAEELRRRGGDPDAAAATPALDAAELEELETTAERFRHTAAAAGGEAETLRARLAGLLDALPAIADLEDERAACVAVRDESLRRLDALQRASAAIEEAARRVHRDVAPRLAASVSGRLRLLTEGRYAEVNVDAERFEVSLRPPERPDLVPLDLLSRGTRDQVGLLLRLALVEVLGEAGEPVPLLLDDPLLSADPERRCAALEFLFNLSETCQVVLTTADPVVADQVRRIAGGDCAVVDVESSRPPTLLVTGVATGGGGGRAARRR